MCPEAPESDYIGPTTVVSRDLTSNCTLKSIDVEKLNAIKFPLLIWHLNQWVLQTWRTPLSQNLMFKSSWASVLEYWRFGSTLMLNLWLSSAHLTSCKWACSRPILMIYQHNSFNSMLENTKANQCPWYPDIVTKSAPCKQQVACN
jgi:hypothetical protein